MAKSGPLNYIEQVRSEMAKVTWPTRKETMVTGAMVFVMVFLAAMFFFFADQLLNYLVSLVLDLGTISR